ncbi:MAG: Hsp20/alpha crystallin family protein [Desulfonauticus sp.]|nr:Hsp20/alpha crystallin family protein [Desulfonauticus sp.]
MARVVLSPWLEIQNMKDELLKLVEEFEQTKRPSHNESVYALWKPRADIFETEDRFVVEVELPGVEENRIAVEIQGKELRVYGERRLEKYVSGSEYHTLERSYGPFARKFTLPDYVDVDNINASLRKGVLTISFAKIKMKERSIKIVVEGD